MDFSASLKTRPWSSVSCLLTVEPFLLGVAARPGGGGGCPPGPGAAHGLDWTIVMPADRSRADAAAPDAVQIAVV